MSQLQTLFSDKSLMDRRPRRPLWLLGILLVLAAEITWLLSRLQVIEIPFFGHQSQRGLVEAGHVIHARQDLKRRARNSLVWEVSRDDDTLYYYDSILTLSQSEANLYLKDRTELHLAENTLVSLEPTEGQSNSEIRLRFSKGDVRARNPSIATKLQDDDWSIMLEKGSDVSVRKQNGHVEFDVHQGRAVLKNQTGMQILGVEDILRLQDGKTVEKLTKSRSLQWKEVPSRHYTHAEVAAVSVQWTGPARKIQIQRVGQAIETVAVAEGAQQQILPLPPGSYTLRLEDETGVSEATRLEVWTAPRIVLRKPLPRDRLKTFVDNEFVWSLVPDVKEYRLHLFRDGETFDKTVKSSVNFLNFKSDQEADLFWQVDGVDEEGHVIPSLYQNPVYFRHDPLEAPKLKGPLLRVPAREKADGAFWFHLLVETAHAEAASDLEAVFQWESVPGADQYTIEICSTPDFRNAEVMKTIRQPEFVWRNFKMQKYYWRVAAGNSGGRMGIFSAPTELNFQTLKPGQTGEMNGVIVKKVAVKKTAILVPTPTPTPEPVVEVKPTPVPMVAEEPEPLVVRRKVYDRMGFAWAPSYRYSDLRSEQSTHLRLAGKAPMNFHFDLERVINEKEYWTMDFWHSEQTWKPDPENEFPFQSTLSVPETWISLEKGRITSLYRQGIALHQSFGPTRSETEVISTASYFLMGYRGSFSSMTEERSYLAGFALLTSGRVHELALDLQAKKYFRFKTDDQAFYLGVQANAVMQAGFSQGQQITGMILIGMDWFRLPAQDETK